MRPSDSCRQDQIITGIIERDDPIEDVDLEQQRIGEYCDRVHKVNAYLMRLLLGSSSGTEAIGARNFYVSSALSKVEKLQYLVRNLVYET